MQPPVTKRKLTPLVFVSEDENTRLRDENARLKQELAGAKALSETRLATMIGYNTIRVEDIEEKISLRDRVNQLLNVVDGLIIANQKIFQGFSLVADRYIGSSGHRNSNSTCHNMQPSDQNSTCDIQAVSKACYWQAQQTGLNAQQKDELATERELQELHKSMAKLDDSMEAARKAMADLRKEMGMS